MRIFMFSSWPNSVFGQLAELTGYLTRYLMHPANINFSAKLAVLSVNAANETVHI